MEKTGGEGWSVTGERNVADRAQPEAALLMNVTLAEEVFLLSLYPVLLGVSLSRFGRV